MKEKKVTKNEIREQLPNRVIKDIEKLDLFGRQARNLTDLLEKKLNKEESSLDELFIQFSERHERTI